MPYRALTHGRVRGAQTAPANAHINQVKAIDSQKGVGNSGPIRKNNSTNSQKTVRTLSRNFLMAPNAYGNGTFSPGQGKGFPEATPLPSVGSVNRFARRAIARRAVTKRIGVKGSENCCIGRFAPKSTPPPTPTLNLTQSFTVQATNALQDINVLPSILNGAAAFSQFYDPANITNGNNHIILWQPANASNATLGAVAQWGSVDYGGSGFGSFILFEYEQGGDNSVAIQIARPAGLVEGETVYTDNFNVKLTVTRASNTASHNAGDVQVLLDHPVAATQMQSGGSPNHAVIQLGLPPSGYANSNVGANFDNSGFIGDVSFNYSDIDFSVPAKQLQLNDVLTLSITPV